MQLTPQQLHILTETVLGEAANQGRQGQAGVVWTILNRAESGHWGTRDPSVIALQKSQFSAWNKGKGGNRLVRTSPNAASYKAAQQVVQDVIDGAIPDPTGGATFYVNPSGTKWRPPGTQTTKIGGHVFYKGDGPNRLPPADIPNPTSRATLRRGMSDRSTDGAVTQLQQGLANAGYDPGPVDGVFGRRTAQAVQAFEKAHPGMQVEKLSHVAAGPQVINALPLPVSPGLDAVIKWTGKGAPGGSPILGQDWSVANPNPPTQRLQEDTGVVQIPDRRFQEKAAGPGAGLSSGILPEGPRQVPTSSVGPDPILVGQDAFGRPAPPGFPPVWGEQPQPFSGDLTGAQLGLANAKSRMWDAFSKSGNPALAEAYKRGLDGGAPVAAPAYGPFDTQLSPQEEAQFQTWKAKNAPGDSGEDYDLRGAFKAGLSPAANGHWSDQFKKPNEPTFSDESQYSTPLHPGGHWNGDQYVPYGSQTGPMGYPGVGQPAPAPDFFDTYGPGVSVNDVGRTLANAPSDIWNWATGGSGAAPASGGGPDDYLGGIGGATPSGAPSVSPTTMQGATRGDISGGGSDNTLRGSGGLLDLSPDDWFVGAPRPTTTQNPFSQPTINESSGRPDVAAANIPMSGGAGFGGVPLDSPRSAAYGSLPGRFNEPGYGAVDQGNPFGWNPHEAPGWQESIQSKQYASAAPGGQYASATPGGAGISSDWQSFLSPPASVANVVHPAQDFTMHAAGDFNGPGAIAAGEDKPDFSGDFSNADVAGADDSLANPIAAASAYAASGLGAPRVPPVAAAAPVRVASPTVPLQVAARAYGPTNSGYGSRYQAPANWGWGNSANAARSAGYTTGIASPQYAQIAASRGYSAPADAFTPGSGGAIYAYHANGSGGGTYVDSQGREHTY